MHLRITSEVVRSAGRRIATTIACALIGLLAAGSAFAQPQIVLSTMNFETDHLTGEVEHFTLNISNPGDDFLSWTTEYEEVERPRAMAPRRDNAGQILDYFIWQRNRADQSKSAIAYDSDNNLIIVSNYEQNYYGLLDPSNGYRLVREWRGGNGLGAFTATWLNGVIYASDPQSNFLQKWDIAGNDLGRINLGDIVPQSISASPELGLLFACDHEAQQGFFVLNSEGRTLAQFNDPREFVGDQGVGNVLWVDWQPEGNLWCESQGTLYELTVDRENWTITGLAQSFQMPAGDQHPYGLGHDAHNMIAGIYWRNDYVVFDDGVFERDWMTYVPTHGMIPSNQDVNMEVTFNAFGLIGGEYVAELHFYSNDPQNPDVVFSVLMHVTGAPDIAVQWPREAGWPDSINFNACNPNIFVGDDSVMPLTVVNQGTDDLDIQEISIDNDLFSISQGQFMLAPDESRQIDLHFTSDEPTNVETVLTIVNNTANSYEVHIPLFASSSEPPRMVPDVQEMEFDSPTEPYRMSIANMGEASLHWCCKLDYPGMRNEPGEELDTLWLPHDDVRSMDWDPLTSTMWAVHGNPAHLSRYHYDAETAELRELFSSDIPQGTAVAFLDSLIYTNDSAGQELFIYGIDGASAGTVNLNFFATDLASSPMNHWIFALDDQAIVHILDAKYNYSEIGTIGGIADQVAPFQAGQIAWSDRNVNGQLWVGCKDQVYEFGIDEYSRARLEQHIPVTNLNRFDGLGHDGENLWLAAWGPENHAVDILDDGTTQSPITVTPFTGALQHGGDTNIMLRFGPYRAAQPNVDYTLHFLSNDPENPDMSLNILIHWLDVDDSPARVTDFVLRPPFPNPFNSTTTIEYSLPRPGRYALSVVDITGREVARLSEGWKAAGSYREVWKAGGRASGTYFIGINSAEERVIRSVILAK